MLSTNTTIHFLINLCLKLMLYEIAPIKVKFNFFFLNLKLKNTNNKY